MWACRVVADGRLVEQARDDGEVERPGLVQPVIMIDVTGLCDHLLPTAIGIDADGCKHVRSVVKGTTESSQVCLNLFRNLIDRGLVVERAWLFEIDGGRGVRSAIRTTFDTWALIQRCQVHKMLNIMAHLPIHKRPWVKESLRRDWAEPNVGKARARSRRLATQLKEAPPGAATSVLEGLEETLTPHKLGLEGALYRTSRSAHLIENVQGTVRRIDLASDAA